MMSPRGPCDVARRPLFTSADGCIQIAVFMDPATSVTRGPSGSAGAGMDLSMFYDDFCNNIFEFGFVVYESPHRVAATLRAPA